MLPVLTAMTPLRSPMASEALMTRFMTTWRIWVASASTAGSGRAKLKRRMAFLEIETRSMCSISSASRLRSTGSTTNFPLPE